MALGRGLSELLGEVETAYSNSTTKNEETKESLGVKKIDVNAIEPNPAQPRRVFDEEKIDELAESIKNYGLIQPVTVIKSEQNGYILVSGERRLRAHKKAGIMQIEAIIMDIEEFKLREIALIENIQRDDLNVIELAYSYAKLLQEHNLTHDELSKRISKSRTSITNTLRLLQLSPYVQQLLGSEKLSAGHAKVLVGLNEDEQKIVADTIIGQKLSVREAEKLVKELKENKEETKEPKLKQKQLSFDFGPLNDSLEVLKNNNLNVKLNKNILKIEIKSQEDIEKLTTYFRNTL